MIPEFTVEEIKQAPASFKASFHEQGAVIVRELINLQLLKRILRQVEIHCCEKELCEPVDDWQSQEYADYAKYVSGRLIRISETKPDVKQIVYDVISKTPAIHAAAIDPELLHAVEALLSEQLHLHERKILLMSLPEESWHLARWHQDFYYNGDPDTTCTVYAPFQKTVSHNGGLLVATNESKNGLLSHVDDEDVSTKWHTIPQDTVKGFKTINDINMNPGDVLFLHSLTPHSAQVNKSQDVRFVMNIRYQDMYNPQYKNNNWKTATLLNAREALARTEKE